MTEPAKTPGQIAYEAYERNFGRDGIDWNDPFLENFRNGWEQAVQDISAPLLQRIAELEAEVKRLMAGGYPYFVNDEVRTNPGYEKIAQQQGLNLDQTYTVEKIFRESCCMTGWLVQVKGYPRSLDSGWFVKV